MHIHTTVKSQNGRYSVDARVTVRYDRSFCTSVNSVIRAEYGRTKEILTRMFLRAI
jgi:hypothetical protein